MHYLLQPPLLHYNKPLGYKWVHFDVFTVTDNGIHHSFITHIHQTNFIFSNSWQSWKKSISMLIALFYQWVHWCSKILSNLSEDKHLEINLCWLEHVFLFYKPYCLSLEIMIPDQFLYPSEENHIDNMNSKFQMKH